MRIDRTEVKAPVAGIVSRRSAKVGATASSVGEPLFRIIEDGAIDLEADVPEQYLQRLACGHARPNLHCPASKLPSTAPIRLVNNEVDRSSRTGKVRIALTDPRGAPGRFRFRGSVDRRERRRRRRARHRRPARRRRRHLLVVKNGVVEDRKVKLGIAEGEWVQVREGLADGESVVARAAAFLRPGDRVRPLEAVTSAMNDAGAVK